MQRTIRLPLYPTSEQAAHLTATSRQFTAVFNAVCAYGWREREKNGVTLHHTLYRPLKDAYPALVSDLHIQARVKAAEALKSAFALQKKGKKVSQPRAVACPPCYNQHTYRVDWNTSTVRLSTTAGRIEVPFTLPAYATAPVGCPVNTADLIERDGS
jgi:putative transposase